MFVQTKQKKNTIQKNKVKLYPKQEKSTQRLFLFIIITSPVNVYCTYKKTAFFRKKEQKRRRLNLKKK